jgi:hypothetical protein
MVILIFFLFAIFPKMFHHIRGSFNVSKLLLLNNNTCLVTTLLILNFGVTMIYCCLIYESIISESIFTSLYFETHLLHADRVPFRKQLLYLDP